MHCAPVWRKVDEEAPGFDVTQIIWLKDQTVSVVIGRKM
jgi:hypothetical protein